MGLYITVALVLLACGRLCALAVTWKAITNQLQIVMI
jgi:hypothetical protein